MLHWPCGLIQRILSGCIYGIPGMYIEAAICSLLLSAPYPFVGTGSGTRDHDTACGNRIRDSLKEAGHRSAPKYIAPVAVMRACSAKKDNPRERDTETGTRKMHVLKLCPSFHIYTDVPEKILIFHIRLSFIYIAIFLRFTNSSSNAHLVLLRLQLMEKYHHSMITHWNDITRRKLREINGSGETGWQPLSFVTRKRRPPN